MVLALVAAAEVEAVLECAQSRFYEPRSRNAFHEGSLMVSTPGDGLQEIVLAD
jgi:hypothetical protein